MILIKLKTKIHHQIPFFLLPEMFVMEDPPTEDADSASTDPKHHVDILLDQLDDPHWLADEALDFGGEDRVEPSPPELEGVRCNHKLRSQESEDVRKSGGGAACRVSDTS